MQGIDIDLGNRSYPIILARNLFSQPETFSRLAPDARVCVVSNTTVAPLYLQAVVTQLGNRACKPFLLPDGERYKTLKYWNKLIDHLAAEGLHRDDALLALGGGVVGDMTGFAAACYMRGIDFFQAPTTLLAQVDAAVGGKTGINHPAGKNLIGAFHQPRAVFIDTATLDTLPAREYHAGLAEVIKYALIGNAGFFDWLVDHVALIGQRENEALQYIIRSCCRDKARIVASDEREQGVRVVLNFGHTFAHALESASGYSRFLHGEAVAIGMMCALRLSAQLGYCRTELSDRLGNMLSQFSLPSCIPEDMDCTRLLDLMRMDKKTRRDGLHLVLIKGSDGAVAVSGVPEAAIVDCLRASGAGG